MTYKTILSYVADDEEMARVLDIAVPLAEKNDAHLIGLHIIPEVLADGFGAYQIPQSILDARRKAEAERGTRLQKAFDTRVASLKHKSEWRQEWGTHPDSAYDVAPHAAAVDLIVTSQSDRDASSPMTQPAATLVMQTGRPVLLVPKIGSFEGVGKRIVIAWNGSPQAARAVFDSLPFLQGAEKVFILVVDPEESSRKNFTYGDYLAASLSRHDVKVEAMNVLSGDLSVTEELLMRVDANDADMVVMGCYGRPNWRELLFGGVTREMLKRTAVPVFMSH